MYREASKEEVLKKIGDHAHQILWRSGNCAQTSFLVLKEQFNLDDGMIVKALTPFPGVALRGETCGAVIGSLMALGLVFGRDNIDDMPGYLRSLPPARKFCRQFRSEEHTSELQSHLNLVCRLLLEKTNRRRAPTATRLRTGRKSLAALTPRA